MSTAFSAGYERLSAWAELLDQINVYPVADADTGRNLMISLAPLRDMKGDDKTTPHRLLMSATGNSGNIANCFFSEFIANNPAENIPQAAKAGRDRAWQAILDPQPGTMLTVLDSLTEQLENTLVKNLTDIFPTLIETLQASVHATAQGLPVLQAAGVVDSGALGIYIFMEGFFAQLTNRQGGLRPITETFDGKLSISTTFQANAEAGFCVDTVIKTDAGQNPALDVLSQVGESIVVTRDDAALKIHLHTRSRAEARKALETLGDVVQWSDEMLESTHSAEKHLSTEPLVRIVTDAAGSVTRKQAQELGITLLDSYIVEENQSLPETLVSPEALYRSMQKGIRITTAQASVFERQQRYQSIISRFRYALYLCVGSVYTGNYDAAMAWREKNDPESRLEVMDTGAASGRLGIIARAVAEYANQGHTVAQVINFAKSAEEQSEEYLFLDRLKYLAAGGRISKSKGFMGDLLHMKPIISPTRDGAAKAGTVRNREQQVDFAMDKIKALSQRADCFSILLEYSDNRQWVEETVLKKIEERYPAARIMITPLSLTSGVHMGPGTWGVALLPSIQTE